MLAFYPELYHIKVVILSLATGTVFLKLEFFPDVHNHTFIPLPQQVVAFQMVQSALHHVHLMNGMHLKQTFASTM